MTTLTRTKQKDNRTLKIKGVEFNARQLESLQKAGVLERVVGAKLKATVGTKYKNNPASTSLANTSALQGPLQSNEALGGIFSSPGVRPQRFSAVQRPRTFMNVLKPRPSEFNEEILEIMTGVTAGTGTNASGFCADPPTPGQAATCKQTFFFGSWYEKTQLNSVSQLGQLRNRAEVPGQILNAGPEENPLVPDIMYRIMDTRSQLQYELYTLGMDYARNLELVGIQGDYSKDYTSANHGFIKEFDGIDKQIKTGHVDPTGTACAALDSIVINFNGNLIGTSVGGGDPRNITQVISDLDYAARDRGKYVGMENASWGFIMRRELFRSLTDFYANTYATSRFQTNTLTAGTPIIQTDSANKLRLEMLNGQFLLVEGVPVPVLFSDGIVIAGQGNSTYESDIYYVPFEWEGFPLINLEFFNMANLYADEYAGFVGMDRYKVLNGGMYRVGYRSTGTCDEYHFTSRMRLILETPFLAGRIDNVSFAYYAATRDAMPGSSFYVNGGPTYQS